MGMGQATGNTRVEGGWIDGAYAFFETGNYGAIARLLTIDPSIITVGSASQDVDFKIFMGASDQYVLFDVGSVLVTFAKTDVAIAGDLTVTLEDISVEQGKYIYLDGQGGGEYVRSDIGGDLMVNATTNFNIAIGGTDQINISATTMDMNANSITDVGDIETTNAAGPTLQNEAATGINPTLIPNRADETTGIGWATAEVRIVISSGDEYDFTASTLDMNGNTLTEVGTIDLDGDLDTSTQASDIIIKADTDSALEIFDSTTKFMDIDTRVTVTGVANMTLTGMPATIVAASGVTHQLLALAPGTTLLTGSTGVTAMNGLGLSVAQPTITSAGTPAVVLASTVYIAAAPVAAGAGPASITAAYALYIAAGVSYFGGLIRPSAAAGADSANALLMGIGTSGDPATTDTASKNFYETRCQTTAASGAGRGFYLRYDIAPDPIGTNSGEAIRGLCVASGHIASATGVSGGFEFHDSNGTISGSATGGSFTMVINNSGQSTGGLYGASAIMHFIGAGGPPTNHACLELRAAGNATGAAKCLNAMSIVSTAGTGSGEMLYNDTIRILYDSSARWIPLSTAEGNFTTAYPIIASYAGTAYAHTSTLAGAATDNAMELLVTDDMAWAAANYGRALYVNYNNTGVKSSANTESNGIGVDIDASANVQSLYGISLYVGAQNGATINRSAGLAIYNDAITGTVAGSNCLYLAMNGGATNDDFIAIRSHTGAQDAIISDRSGGATATNLLFLQGLNAPAVAGGAGTCTITGGWIALTINVNGQAYKIPAGITLNNS